MLSTSLRALSKMSSLMLPRRNSDLIATPSNVPAHTLRHHLGQGGGELATCRCPEPQGIKSTSSTGSPNQGAARALTGAHSPMMSRRCTRPLDPASPLPPPRHVQQLHPPSMPSHSPTTRGARLFALGTQRVPMAPGAAAGRSNPRGRLGASAPWSQLCHAVWCVSCHACMQWPL